RRVRYLGRKRGEEPVPERRHIGCGQSVCSLSLLLHEKNKPNTLGFVQREDILLAVSLARKPRQRIDHALSYFLKCLDAVLILDIDQRRHIKHYHSQRPRSGELLCQLLAVLVIGFQLVAHWSRRTLHTISLRTHIVFPNWTSIQPMSVSPFSYRPGARSEERRVGKEGGSGWT